MSTPEFLGPYRVGETLGRGGMGTVFQAVHEKSGQQVAVKLIAAHVADDMKFRRRFDAEIETLKRLRHENIVSLIGYGEEDGQLFYSMELVDGEPLQKRIRREKRLSWIVTIDIAIQICAALKHAHDIGVIHRDLKPANLVLTDGDQVKLVDFGIAKIFGSGEQTMAGSVLGTADYMAPEQAIGDGITLRSDLYALGSVMYAMSAGRAPFKGKKITEVIASLKRDKPIPLEMIVPEFPEALTELIHQLLEKDPANRPPTALAVMNRLKAMRNGLLRDQTLHYEQDRTEIRDRSDAVAQDATAISGGDTPASSDKRTPVSGIESAPTPAGKATTSSEIAGDKSLGVDVDHAAGTVHHLGKDLTNATRLAKPLAQAEPPKPASTSSPETKRSTHFQTVDDSPSESGIFQHATEASNRLTQVLSIAAIVGLLLLGCLLIAVSFKKPTADELYENIMTTTSSGTLSDAREQIDQFLKLYPDHEHQTDVSAMDLSLRRDAVIRRLQLQSKLPGRKLDPHEQAFLEAMEQRDVDPELAKTRLQQWLDVFVDSTTHADDSRKQIATLVEFERDRLDQQTPQLGDDQRNRQLIARISTADELGHNERVALLQGIIELYSGSQWATPAVSLARDRLADALATAEKTTAADENEPKQAPRQDE